MKWTGLFLAILTTSLQSFIINNDAKLFLDNTHTITYKKYIFFFLDIDYIYFQRSRNLVSTTGSAACPSWFRATQATLSVCPRQGQYICIKSIFFWKFPLFFAYFLLFWTEKSGIIKSFVTKMLKSLIFCSARQHIDLWLQEVVLKRAADLAEALYAMPRGASLGARPDSYSNYTSQLAAIGRVNNNQSPRK